MRTLIPTNTKPLQSSVVNDYKKKQEQNKSKTALRTVNNKEVRLLSNNDQVEIQPIATGVKTWKPASESQMIHCSS